MGSVLSATGSTTVNAQSPPAAAPAKKAVKEEKVLKIPDPINVNLETKDRVNLACTFFGAPEDEDGSLRKSAIPFILVHDWDSNRKDLLPFAKYLQSLGHAVIVPDLRGHGESNSLVGDTKELDYEKFRKNEVGSTVIDLETCKKYLVERNDEGELNIDLLNVVAVGESSVFAILWTLSDWAWPNTGPIKQGKDVKGLTLISPQKKVKGIGLGKALKSPLLSGRNYANLPTLVVWSEGDEKGADDSAWMFDYMKKGRPNPEDTEDPSQRVKDTTLFQAVVPGGATGTELLRDNPVDGFWAFIGRFVETKVGKTRADYRWQSRNR